jgi:decaprenylphospho-beta-D-ribofuranose 2-oxidase
MSLSGWGRYPLSENQSVTFRDGEMLRQLLAKSDEVIAFGNGRSYGDSALNDQIIRCKPYNYFLGFDADRGVLHVQAGVLLSEILRAFVHRGWFLMVTPGTRLITVGGAIASDVHGKNHHQVGCFSECVESFNMMLPNGEVVCCSRQQNYELFQATCGGMGLTGIILDVQITLVKINSAYLDQKTIKTRNLRDTFNAFEQHQDSPYSVDWLDCLASGDSLGRCLLMTGEFRNDGELSYQSKAKPGLPCNFPSFALNKWSIKVFNGLYYGKAKAGQSLQLVDIDSFFYPLDAIANWNRIYGKNGFTQYQFVLPKESSYEGLREILSKISRHGKGSFLAVLKLCGAANDNLLSFPMAGYSLALDFKIEPEIFDLLNRLDDIVVQYGGRIYLAKDARVSKDIFEKGYSKIEAFKVLRQRYKMNEKFNSLQSRRLGI